METTDTGLGLVQPEDLPGDENMLPHVDPAHICYRGCYAWEDPYWPESCGDED